MADYIPHFNPVEEIEVPEGHYRDITLHDGSTIRLETISAEHDPGDAMAALTALHEAETDKKHVTGLLYYDPEVPTATDTLGLTETPLVDLPEELLRPSMESLDGVNSVFRS